MTARTARRHLKSKKQKREGVKGGGAGDAKLILHNDLTSSAGDQVTLAFRLPLHASVLFLVPST